MTKTEIIVTILCSIISSGILNLLITHFFYRSKLKTEIKYNGNGVISKEVETSLKFVRDVELGLRTQEIYNIENELSECGSNINIFGGECIYPAIFNDWNSYNSYYELIQECRNKHEKNLSCEIALNLVFLDRYLMQLSIFMNEHGNESKLPAWGTIFIFDLLKWQKKFDKMLVSEINKHSFKLESHDTKKWQRKRKREVEEQYKNTILNFLLTGKCNKRNRKKMELIKMITDSL